MNQYLIYIYYPYTSNGLKKDALLFNKYIKNSKIISDTSEIEEEKYILLLLENVREIKEQYLKNAEKVLLMVNYDFLDLNNKLNRYIDLYICKNYTTYKIMHLLIENDKINSGKLLYTSFSTYYEIPLFNPEETKDFKMFLHSAGKSSYKNTQIIIETWINNNFPPIIITCFEKCFNKLLYKDIDFLKSKNIILITKELNEKKINKIKNRCGIHICPSMREGYGHYINECRMVKSVCVTLDTNPYNEMVDKNSGFFIPVEKTEIKPEYSFQFSFYFNSDKLAKRIKEILLFDENILKQMGEYAYVKYLNDEEYFRQNMKKIRRLI